MKNARIKTLLAAAAVCLTVALHSHTSSTAIAAPAKTKAQAKKSAPIKKVVRTEAEWKKILSPEAYRVLREKGTQAPYQGDYHPRKEIGIYRCAGCNLDLYDSRTKFDSGTGWPSFWKPIAGHVIEKTDADGERVEVLCARCDGHLGHVFDDGPKPTGLRYCMNDVALRFVIRK